MALTGDTIVTSPLTVESLFDVKHKTVLVTGGGRGIGLMIAAGFVQNHANVFICSRKAKVCQAVARALTQRGPGTCTAIEQSADLSTRAGCAAVMHALQTTYHVKHLHVLVNNSGVAWGEPIDNYAEIGFDKCMDLNVKGLFYSTTEALPLLEAAARNGDPARVINIGSIAGIQHQVVPTYAYDASKAAVHMLTRKMACDLARRGITVNAIAPGFVPSNMSKGLLAYTSKERLAKSIPMGSLGTPQDMAGVALYLASRAGAWVTGSILKVDGGAVVAVTTSNGASSSTSSQRTRSKL